jgi:hypothetical protein
VIEFPMLTQCSLLHIPYAIVSYNVIILGDPSTHAYDELYCQLTYATFLKK